MAWGAGAVLNTSFELGAAFGSVLVEQHPDAPAALLDCLAPGGSPLQNSNAAGALMNLTASSALVTADVLQRQGVARLTALLAAAKTAEQEGDSVAACHAAGALANLLRDPDAVETLLGIENPSGARTIVEALEGETEEARRHVAAAQPASRLAWPATRLACNSPSLQLAATSLRPHACPPCNPLAASGLRPAAPSLQPAPLRPPSPGEPRGVRCADERHGGRRGGAPPSSEPRA